MNKPRIYPLTLSLTLVALAVTVGCSTLSADNPLLIEARNDYRNAQADPQTREMAPVELKAAGDALGRADQAFSRKDSSSDVSHLAYVAKQRVAIAQETTRQKVAEMTVANAEGVRDKLRLAARTTEADAAQRSAEVSQRQSDESRRQADAAQRQAAASRQQAASSQQQAATAQQQAGDAEARSRQLEAQLKDLNAKKTDRGMVMTIGDVLFDTNMSQLKSGGMRSIEKLVGFMKEYPQRKALIEGFTDSVGNDAHNQELSARRADAVRAALAGMGVAMDRLATQGYGEAYPVAGNDSAGGRQMNRRVEIVLSDENGAIRPH